MSLIQTWCGWAPPPKLRVQQIMFLSAPHGWGCETSPAWQGQQGCGHPNLGWAGKGSTLGCGEPWGAQLSSPCSVGTANALGRAYLNWRSSSTCCWPQKSNWILRKNYQATRQSCYWVSKGQGDMLITFVFREMLIWNAQRVTLSITISAYIDYISA